MPYVRTPLQGANLTFSLVNTLTNGAVARRKKSFTPSPSSSANFKTLTASFSIFKNGVYHSWQAETMPKIAIFDYQLANPSPILHRLSPSISLTPAPLPRPADTSSSVSCSLPTRTSWTSSAQVRISRASRSCEPPLTPLRYHLQAALPSLPSSRTHKLSFFVAHAQVCSASPPEARRG